LFFLATLFWAAGYDTIYALMDKDDDLRIGVKSTAILFGRHVGLAVAILFLLAVLSLTVIGWISHMGYPYHGAIGVVILYLMYQSLRISGEIDRDALFGLFRAHVWIGMIILAGIETDLMLRGAYAI
jgi:4-hydroxybenzoate polyprenyltransferase